MVNKNEGEMIQLLEKAQAGDEGAMVKILMQFGPLIRKIAMKADPDDREDVEQELLLTLIKAVRRFEIRG